MGNICREGLETPIEKSSLMTYTAATYRPRHLEAIVSRLISSIQMCVASLLEIKVPYFSEKLKLEMYSKYKQDPEQWSVTALSKAYGTSMERTKAVLLLLEQREQLKRERGLLDIPDDWFEMHKKFEEFTNAPTQTPPSHCSIRGRGKYSK